jgi:hypothetical protein
MRFFGGRTQFQRPTSEWVTGWWCGETLHEHPRISGGTGRGMELRSDRWRNGSLATSDSKKDLTAGGLMRRNGVDDGQVEKRRLGSLNSKKDLTAGGLTQKKKEIIKKGNLKMPVKTRTLHLSEPYDSRSTTHTAMQPRKDKS